MLSQLKPSGFKCLTTLLVATLSAANLACAHASSRSVASSEGGGSTGGGDAVVCRNASGGIQSVEFYDLYEGREIDEQDLEFGPSNLDDMGQVRFVLNKMARLNPTRAKKYLQQAQEFKNDAKWVYGKELFDVPDTGIGYVPNHCKLEQAAIQQLESYGGKRYLVNGDLYNAMGPKSQAALIIHELLYREYGPGTSSINVRKFNTFLWSKAAKSASLRTYIEKISPLNFAEINDHNGLLCSIRPGYYNPDRLFFDENTLKECSALKGSKLRKIDFLGAEIDADIEGGVFYAANGNIIFREKYKTFRGTLNITRVYAGSKDVEIRKGLFISFTTLSSVVTSGNPLQISLSGHDDMRNNNVQVLNSRHPVISFSRENQFVKTTAELQDLYGQSYVTGTGKAQFENKDKSGAVVSKVFVDTTNRSASTKDPGALKLEPEFGMLMYSGGQYQIEFLEPTEGWIQIAGHGSSNTIELNLTLTQSTTAPVILKVIKDENGRYYSETKISKWKVTKEGLKCREIKSGFETSTQCQKTLNVGEKVTFKNQQLYQLPETAK